jgi:uncharacterized protein
VEAYLLNVRVTPRSSRDEIIGWNEGELRVRLRAPPVEGRANEALRRFLAERLDVPLADIELVGGLSSRSKRVSLIGLSEAEVRLKLG